ARAQGWSVWYEPSLPVVHHRPLHARRVNPVLRLLTRHALLTYARRHWAGWQVRLLAGLMRLECWLRAPCARPAGESASLRDMGRIADVVHAVAHNQPALARRIVKRVVRQQERGCVSASRL